MGAKIRLWFVLLVLVVCVGIAFSAVLPANGLTGCTTKLQLEQTPTLPDDSPVIAPENAASLSQITRIGRGQFYDFAWSPDCQQLAVSSSVGVWVYSAVQAPRLLTAEHSSAAKVTFSRDGKQIAAAITRQRWASTYSGVAVWDAESSNLIGTWQNPVVYALSFTPEGNIHAFTTTSDENDYGLYVAAWRLTPGDGGLQAEQINVFGPNLVTRRVETDGSASRMIIGGGYIPGSRENTSTIDYNVRIWDLNSEGELPFGTLPLRNISAEVALSPDGKTAAVHTGQLRLYDVQTGAQIALLDGTVTGPMVFSADGTLLAFPGTDDDRNPQFRLYDLPSRRDEVLIEHYTDSVYDLAFTPDNRALTILERDATGAQALRIYDLASGDSSALLPSNTILENARLSADEKALVSVSDGRVDAWNVETGERFIDIPSTGSDETILTAPESGRSWMAVVRSNGLTEERSIGVWDLASGEQLFENDLARFSGINGAAFSHDGRLLAFSGTETGWDYLYEDSSIELWDTATWTQTERWVGYGYPLFSPDDKLLIQAGDTILVRDLTNGEVLNFETDFAQDRNKAMFTQSGYVMFYGRGGYRDAYDLHSQRHAYHIEGRWGERFSPNGELGVMQAVYDSDYGGTRVVVWDAATGDARFLLEAPNVDYFNSFQFSPDSRYLLGSANIQKQSWIWDLANGNLILEHGDIDFQTFSPDGRLLAGVDDELNIRLWDTTRWAEIATFAVHTTPPVALTFNRAGTLLFSQGEGVVRVWAIAQ